MPREINNFRSFNEANIRNNRALDPDYIDNIKDNEVSDAHRKIQSREVVQPTQIMPLVEEMMRLQGGELQFTRQGPVPQWHDYDKKAEIEELARSIINDRYGRLLNSLNVEMDIELVDPSELQEMKDGCEMCDDSPEPPPEFEETDDENLRDDIDKRKIANIITQGSAKNVHRLIHLYQEKIEDVDPRLFEVMDRLIKSNEAAEWLHPENENNGKMIRQMMNGFTKTEFESPEQQQEFEEMKEDFDIDSMEDFDQEEEFEAWNGKIKVTARAIDLVVLLHESVKGIFEVLGSPSIPEFDAQRAEDIMANTDTLQDEFEDLRYGPRIREDLLNWVNSNDKVNQIDDGFEYVWGAMISIESAPFLELFFDAIIEKTGKADKWLDNTLDKLIREDEELRKAQFEYDQQKRDFDSQQQSDKLSQPKSQSQPKEIEEVSDQDQEPDYSKMNQRELGILRDELLDRGDYETLKKISKYLK